MRRIIVNNIVSLDGYYADATGNPLVLNMDAAFDQANLDSINAADMVLLGRDSFDGFSSYWPFIVDAPEPADADAPEARAFNEVNRAISRRYNAIPKVVVSDRGPVATDNAWAQTTTVIPRDEAAGWIADAKQNGDGDIVVFGSRRTWNGLLSEGLVDELHLMVSPTVLGDGVRLFGVPADLDLVECRRFEDSPNVQLRYRVTSPRPDNV
ncbi:dihydrofolate reductase family protein [Tessaracoccus caeni]|uniref:dihydrofolate reductase family protein n=1 Tax=Tessaracoccus caeni TaxID=3031239 RepID=UPI0023D98274|nr:dihydrofolate reductase family protein [Tessaracoccus caeni]MDF1487486.1 dihydrofolate reductase family protein [Tessaracoccus caeni]